MKQWWDYSLADDEISQLGAVPCYVPKGPHTLLGNTCVVGGEESDEERDGTTLHHYVRLL